MSFALYMGHPLGATGAMILGTLVDELHRRKLRYGLATLCVGGGMMRYDRGASTASGTKGIFHQN